MSYVERSIKTAADRLLDDCGYSDPGAAYCRCVPASEQLQERLTPEIVTFRMGVITCNDFAEGLSETEGTDIEQSIWHAVCYVPQVGAIDVTGAQFGESAVRVMEVPPDCWERITQVYPPPGLPITLEDADLPQPQAFPETPSDVFEMLNRDLEPRSGF